MGQQAKLTASRRALRREEHDRMLTFQEAKRNEPGLAAHHAALEADTELQARAAADFTDQCRRLNAAGWRQAFSGVAGAGGWAHRRRRLQMIHSLGREADGHLWGHMSLAVHGDTEALPPWEHMRDAHWALYPGLYGVQVVAPADKHVDISQAVHVWTCLTAQLIPDFGRFGTI